jgi:lipoate---protein ligase
MHFLDLTLPSLAENLALDEALLLAAESGAVGEALRLWEWPSPAVVLGSGCRLTEDVNEPACAVDSVPILRRSSGGGTVLLGSGCLIYSLILSYERDPSLTEIRSSYRFILGRLAAGLSDEPAVLEPAGISDLALAGCKFSGTAQQRKRSFLLHHGTILYQFDLSLIPRYLHEPARQPDYRAGRSHRTFVCNLPLDRPELQPRLQRIWSADTPLQHWPHDEVRRLTAEKYTNDEWTRRR